MGVGFVNKSLTEATVVMKKLDTPKASLAEIEILVCFTALLLIFPTIFGSSRRWHTKFKMVLWAAYTLSSHLITYTLGLMTEGSTHNELFPVWAAFLMIFFGCSDSFSAYRLEDNEQWRNYAWQYLIKNFGLVTLVIVYASTSPMLLGVSYLLLMGQLKVGERALSLTTASVYGLQRTTKLIADYMSSEHKLYPHEPDPIQMKGYKYVVGGEEKRWVNGVEVIFKMWKALAKMEGPNDRKKLKERKAVAQMEALRYRKSLEITDEVITVEKVWACEGSLLSSTDGDKDCKLKDICLSFSLYKLLSLRFCSYSMPKEAHKKVRKLIQHMLEGENDYERAFRVTELELSFLYDLFYTNYGIIFYPGRLFLKLMELFLLIVGSLLTIGLSFLWYYKIRPQDEVQLATSGGLSIDLLMTSVILIVFICLEFLQLFFMATSEWAKVLLLCKYVRKKSWQLDKRIEKRIARLCRTQLWKPWARKLRQYSLLESYGYTPPRWLYNRFTAAYIDYIRDGQKQSVPAKLCLEVKKAVFDSLVSNFSESKNGEACSVGLKNGEASLKLNDEVNKLSWACCLETQTQVIFVWHIATSICEHEVPISESDFLVATSLSKYLAYLVAFSPRLLPDHPYDAEYVFNQIILESRNLLEGCNTGKERIRKLKEIGRTRNNTGRVLNQGARLGQQLLEELKDPKFIWKVLAKFWAELMVYVAPSDDAKAHAEHLATGGEFVTHLWALVSHAGVKRDTPVERPPSTDAEAGPIGCDIVHGRDDSVSQ
ncbi:hypothetical protein NL676_011920 [Syzygium grande]|nr:hypothetical protein NL676_011920 [Syzygium grande]